MRIYTSYYSRVSRIDTSEYLLVRVSNTSPEWFEKKLYKIDSNVYPDWTTINNYKSGEITRDEFRALYARKITSQTQPEFIYQELENLGRLYGKENIVLLCWEKDAQACHRTMLAELISKGDYIGEL